MSIQSLLRKWTHPVVKSIAFKYLSKERSFKYKDLKIRINPGVFHPGIFSTKVLLKYLEKISLNDKNVLEVGSGSGIISILAAKSGANVTALDINPKAVKNTNDNCKRAGVNVEVIESDLFSSLSENPKNPFDLILVNPPFFKKDPESIDEFAWYAGKDLKFFKNFFSEVSEYLKPDGDILMLLNEDCDLDEIKNLSTKYEFYFKEKVRQKVWEELIYIFRISKTDQSPKQNIQP